jgi:hypothetical protein
MDKKEFTRITKEVFLAYGFVKKRDTFLLILDEITIACKLYTWNSVRSFNYWISVNGLYDDSVPYEKRYGTYLAIKMEHTPSAEGYHKSEIKYEDYTETQCREILNSMLHIYFDPYKQDALQHVKNILPYLHLKPDGMAYLGINDADPQ